jgi:hypothetical protein
MKKIHLALRFPAVSLRSAYFWCWRESSMKLCERVNTTISSLTLTLDSQNTKAE